MPTTIADRLSELGIVLPEAAAPAANYVPYLNYNGMLHISGQLPMQDGKIAFTGTLGAGVETAEGQEAARLCAINILAQAKAALGDLENIAQVIRLNGFVNSAEDFGDHPAVINGASNLIADVLGDRGKHTRVAVGVANLPFGAAVEIDAIIATKNG
ncbi:MAG: RidA family protein [Hyphomicrobiaceae bacterium]